MANTTPKYTYITFLKFIWTTRKLTQSYFGSQFHWSERKRILTTERATREHRGAYYRRQRNFPKE